MNSTPLLNTQVNIGVDNTTLVKLFLFAVITAVAVFSIQKSFR